MIGRLTGQLLVKQAPELLIGVQGVGYEVQVSMTTYFTLPPMGETVTLHTHFVVREDAQQLFGFASDEERALFRALIRVSGVGPKMALAILSGMTAEEFVRCVRSGDTQTLTRLPGVGKKTAERLLVEMRDRLAGWHPTAGDMTAVPGPANHSLDATEEAESALVALGYKPQEAARMVSGARADAGDVASSEELIRLALKSSVRSKN